MINKSISVFLPALNEEENIKECVLSVQNYLNKRFSNYEILIITAGSKDNTEKIVLGLAKKNKQIKLINNKKTGYGEALRSGFTHASNELIFYTDSDNQFNIEDLDKLFPLLGFYDIVSGYRKRRKDPPLRIFIAFVYNALIRIFFNLKIRDVDASFKLYKKDVFKNIKLESKTGLIDAEVLIKAKKKGFHIGQIGITHNPRTRGRTVYGVGKRNTFVRPKVIFDVLWEMKRLWGELR